MTLILTLALMLRDLEAMKAVCRRRGWEFREGQRRYRWFGRWLGGERLPRGLAPKDLGRCHHAIAVPGCAYEIGLLRRGGDYLVAWDDNPDGGLAAAVGAGCGVLWQSYVSERVRRACLRRRHVVSRLIDCEGTLRVRVMAVRSKQVAHVRVTKGGQAELWLLGDGEEGRATFRYLAEALGKVLSEKVALPGDDVAISQPSRESPNGGESR